MNTTLIERAKETNLTDLVERALGQPRRKSGKWIQWMCPFHSDGHSPSFSVNRENNSWRCFGCNQGGDAIKFVMLYEKLDFLHAVEVLTAGSASLEPRPAPAPQQPPVNYQTWGASVSAIVETGQRYLWGSDGRRAAAYLRDRCITDQTAQEHRLGYWPEDTYTTRAALGLPGDGRVWIPRGILIPYISQGRVWSVNIRRPVGQPKYYKIPGSRPAIYNYDALRGACLSVFTEGELDAILLYQDCPEATAATLGGAAVSKIDLGVWGANLLTIDALYIASDTDAAGLSLAAGLGDFSRRFHRLPLPGGKDITEYRRSGGDLAAWVMEGIRV